MIEPDHGLRFSLKTLQALRVIGEAQWQKFERGFAARDNVGGQIDFAHPAAAYRFRNFVVADGLADEQASLSLFDNIRSKAGQRRLR